MILTPFVHADALRSDLARDRHTPCLDQLPEIEANNAVSAVGGLVATDAWFNGPRPADVDGEAARADRDAARKSSADV